MGKNSRLHLRIESEEKEEFEKIIGDDFSSVSDCIRDLMSKYKQKKLLEKFQNSFNIQVQRPRN